MKLQHKPGLTGKIKAGDFAVMLVIAAAALGIWLLLLRGTPTGKFRLITPDGTEYLSGDTERVIHAGGFTLKLVIQNGEAGVTQSDCPTQDCVHTPAISRPGQSIVCLPAGVVIEVCGEEADAYDGIGG